MNELRTAPLLFIDCQTTGPYANGGNLLELGWQSRFDGRPPEKFSATVQLPDGATIPARVRQLTGLDESDLAQALSRQQMRERLLATLDAVKPITLVIHYARFERPFLKALLGNQCPTIYCTYDIAQRVLARLPSYGIASLAGYFGAHLKKRNRAHHHAAATEAIYDGLVEQLERRGIINFTDLDALLQEPNPRRRDRRWVFSLPPSARLELPKQPGVYRFQDARGRVLYVGKATSLKNRVNSYFQKRRGLSTLHRELLTQVAQVDTSVCATTVHAALLECKEIQRHDPPYNRRLKTVGRQLAFCNHSLEQIATDWNLLFCIGPFPSPWIPQSLNSLFHLLQGHHRDDNGLFSNSVATVDLEQGLDDFREKLALKKLRSPRDLLAQGLRLLRRTDSADGQENTVDQDNDVTDLTPAKLSERCQRILLNAAQHYRRAHGLTRLLNTEVHWRETNVHHIIRLRDYVKISIEAENWAGLGVEIYDLARTLLSEIHRLRASGVLVNIQSSTHHATNPKDQSQN